MSVAPANPAITEPGSRKSLPDPMKPRRISAASRTKTMLTSRLGSAAAIIIAILWTVPTVGLFISSIRPEGEIRTDIRIDRGQPSRGPVQPRASRHSNLGPRAPRDRGCGESLAASQLRETIEKPVGRSVVHLPRRAEKPGAGRAEHETTQRQIERRLVQVPGCSRLGGEDRRKALPALLLHGGVVEHCSGMHHVIESPPEGTDRSPDPIDLPEITHVAAQELDFGSLVAQAVEARSNPRGRFAAAREHQLPRSELHEAGGQLEPHAAETAGDPYRTVPEFMRVGGIVEENNLPDVPGLGHIPEGVHRTVDRERTNRERTEFAALEPVEEQLEAFPDPQRLSLARLAQIEDVIRRFRLHLRGPAGIPYARLADLDEAPIRCEHVERCGDEVIRQRVQNDVHTSPIGVA